MSTDPIRNALISLVLVAGGCAVEGLDSVDDETGIAGGKADDPGAGDGSLGITLFNTCGMELWFGVIPAGADRPSVEAVIASGSKRFLPALRNDRLVTTQVGGRQWRTIDYIEDSGEVELDPGWCPWDVFVESATVTATTADGRYWDSYAIGTAVRPDPYVIGYADGEAVNCQGHPNVEGSSTSTSYDTTTPAWNQEILSWLAWHDMSDHLALELIDDDVGIGGEPIGTCLFEDIPTPDALPAVVTTSDCSGGGSATIRIEPADRTSVDSTPFRNLGSCS